MVGAGAPTAGDAAGTAATAAAGATGAAAPPCAAALGGTTAGSAIASVRSSSLSASTVPSGPTASAWDPKRSRVVRRTARCICSAMPRTLVTMPRRMSSSDASANGVATPLTVSTPVARPPTVGVMVASMRGKAGTVGASVICGSR